MTRALGIQMALALVAAAAGGFLLFRGERSAYGSSQEGRYAIRILGMMLLALGLFLGGFAAMFLMAGSR